MRTQGLAGLLVALLAGLAAGDLAAAEKEKAPGKPAEESTELERMTVTPPGDIFSEGDRKRRELENSLPGITQVPPPDTFWDRVVNSVVNADLNQASAGQRQVIEKQHDPDYNRLPR